KQPVAPEQGELRVNRGALGADPVIELAAEIGDARRVDDFAAALDQSAELRLALVDHCRLFRGAGAHGPVSSGSVPILPLKWCSSSASVSAAMITRASVPVMRLLR